MGAVGWSLFFSFLFIWGSGVCMGIIVHTLFLAVMCRDRSDEFYSDPVPRV